MEQLSDGKPKLRTSVFDRRSDSCQYSASDHGTLWVKYSALDQRKIPISDNPMHNTIWQI